MYASAEDRDIPFVVDLINRAYRGVGGSLDGANEEAYLEGDRTTAALLRADISARPSASLLRWIDTDSRALTAPSYDLSNQLILIPLRHKIVILDHPLLSGAAISCRPRRLSAQIVVGDLLLLKVMLGAR
jgi:hypothetical protein